MPSVLQTTMVLTAQSFVNLDLPLLVSLVIRLMVFVLVLQDILERTATLVLQIITLITEHADFAWPTLVVAMLVMLPVPKSVAALMKVQTVTFSNLAVHYPLLPQVVI